MGWFDDQIRERMRSDQEVFEDSIFRMASVVLGRQKAGIADSERIITKAAIDEILKYYHYKPAEIPDTIKDPDEQLEFCLRPHGIMRRTVKLEKGWYNDAFGPMLAFRKEDGTPVALLPEYLLVDGYNIIFAWEELKALAAESLEAARQSLADLLSNYQGYRKCGVILVFDAYKVKGNPGSVEKYKNIHIVYTKEAETADAFIEKATYDMRKQYRVRVATSDGMEQLIILGHGATRVPANIFLSEIRHTHLEIDAIVQKYRHRALKGSTVREMTKKKQ